MSLWHDLFGKKEYLPPPLPAAEPEHDGEIAETIQRVQVAQSELRNILKANSVEDLLGGALGNRQ